MKPKKIESHLLETMHRLEIAAERIAKTSGYSEDTKKIRFLLELIKEQIPNENSLSTARQVR